MNHTGFPQGGQRSDTNSHAVTARETAAIFAKHSAIRAPVRPVNIEALSSGGTPTHPADAMHPKGKHALALFRAGAKIVPLGVDLKNPPRKNHAKIPIWENWTNRWITTEEELIEVWSEANYNIGMLMGLQRNGQRWIAIDVDTKNGKSGNQSLAAWETLYDLDTTGRRTETPSGGRHLIFSTERDGFTNDEYAPGIDIKCDGGQIVAPGSTIGGKPYVGFAGHTPALPAALADFLTSKRSNSAGGQKKYTQADALADAWDMPENISRAVHYLTNDAPDSIEGFHGDDTSHRVIRTLWDLQISESEAYLLFEEHYNATKCAPPWSETDADRLVSSVYRGGDMPPGNADAFSEFSGGGYPADVSAEVERSGSETEDEKPLGTPFDPLFDVNDIPPRDWLVDKFLCRTFVTCIISPGGMGKTQLGCQFAVALPTNRGPEIIGLKTQSPVKVWYWNQEDDMNELKRRVGAAMKKHQIASPELSGKLFLDSGVEKPMKLAKRSVTTALRETKTVNEIIAFIKENEIDVFIVDPLIEMHEAKENDNGEMKEVAGMLRKIAVAADCAVLVIGHSKKPPQAAADSYVGDADSLRGGSSQINVFRIAYTLANMSEKDAKRWGVPDADRHDYVRLDAAKANLFKKEPTPYWFKRDTVMIGRSSSEQIGVLDPVTLAPRNSQHTDLLEIVAKTIAGNPALQRDSFYPLSDLIKMMPVGTKAAFGGDSNRARLLTEALNGPGWAQTGEHLFCGETNYGRMTVIKKIGRNGTKVSLALPLDPGGQGIQP